MKCEKVNSFFRNWMVPPCACGVPVAKEGVFVSRKGKRMKFYCYKKCSTCKKAAAFLRAHNATFEMIDYTEQPLTVAELRQYWRASGLPLKKFFNTSGMLYRELDMKHRLTTLTEDDQLALLAAHPMLVKRPIMVTGQIVLVGFDEAKWAEVLGGDSNDNWIIRTVKALNVPTPQYAVFGSGLLDVWGLKKANDIDLVVTKELFDVLAQGKNWERFTYPDGFPGLKDSLRKIEVFYQADLPFCSREEVKHMIDSAIEVEGVNFVNIGDILAWKRARGREKDVRDVELIEKFLQDKKERS